MININLLPELEKSKIVKAKKSANIFSICLVAILIFALICFILYGLKNFLQTQLDNINEDISGSNSSFASFDKLQGQAVFISDRAKIAEKIEIKRATWSVILQDLINSVPNDVQFVSLNSDISKSPNFTLQGNTTSEREAIKFKDKLESSNFFKDVNFKSSTANNGSTTQGQEQVQSINFSLEFNLERLSTDTRIGGSK